jgi:hypothetical protein
MYIIDLYLSIRTFLSVAHAVACPKGADAAAPIFVSPCLEAQQNELARECALVIGGLHSALHAVAYVRQPRLRATIYIYIYIYIYH